MHTFIVEPEPREGVHGQRKHSQNILVRVQVAETAPSSWTNHACVSGSGTMARRPCPLSVSLVITQIRGLLVDEMSLAKSYFDQCFFLFETSIVDSKNQAVNMQPYDSRGCSRRTPIKSMHGPQPNTRRLNSEIRNGLIFLC